MHISVLRLRYLHFIGWSHMQPGRCVYFWHMRGPTVSNLHAGRPRLWPSFYLQMLLYKFHERALAVDSQRPYVTPHFCRNIHLFCAPRVRMHQTVHFYSRLLFQFCFFETQGRPTCTRNIVLARFLVGRLNSFCSLSEIVLCFICFHFVFRSSYLILFLVFWLSHPCPFSFSWMLWHISAWKMMSILQQTCIT